MAKRVSLQGKGVELFFGGRSPDEGAIADPEAHLRSSKPVGGTAASSVQTANGRTRARTQASNPDLDLLFQGLGDKQRLASSTFRFQPEELDQLDELFEVVSRARPRRVSKNDLVRLGLRSLLSDYHADPSGSLVGQLIRRV